MLTVSRVWYFECSECSQACIDPMQRAEILANKEEVKCPLCGKTQPYEFSKLPILLH